MKKPNRKEQPPWVLEYRETIFRLFAEETEGQVRKQKDLIRVFGVSKGTVSKDLARPGRTSLERLRAHLSPQHFGEAREAAKKVRAAHKRSHVSVVSVGALEDVVRKLIADDKPQQALDFARDALEATSDPNDRYTIYGLVASLCLRLTMQGDGVALCKAWSKEAEQNGDLDIQIKALLHQGAAMRLSMVSKKEKALEKRIETLWGNLPDYYENRWMLFLEAEAQFIVARLNRGEPLQEDQLRSFLGKLKPLLGSAECVRLSRGIHGMMARLYTALGMFPEALNCYEKGLAGRLDSVVDSLESYQLVHVEWLIAQRKFSEAAKSAESISASARSKQDMYAHLSAQRLLVRAQEGADDKLVPDQSFGKSAAALPHKGRNSPL